MKTGKIFSRFTAQDGREVILRTLKWEDLDDVIALINSLVEEGADIARMQKVTRDEEADWLGKKLANLENDAVFLLGAEVDGKLIANSKFRMNTGRSSHVSEIGIIIRKGYRDKGIGTEMLNILLSEAKKRGLKLVFLRVFATNERAFHVYKKVGFVESGRIPQKIFKKGKYIDEVIMVKLLEE
jgi:RimJ/RimL family protein N-acetyltransferase